MQFVRNSTSLVHTKHAQIKWICGRPRRRDVAAASTLPAKTALVVSKMAAVHVERNLLTVAASVVSRSIALAVSRVFSFTPIISANMTKDLQPFLSLYQWALVEIINKSEIIYIYFHQRKNHINIKSYKVKVQYIEICI